MYLASLSFYQPYRYALNRVPVCPSIGTHDTRETEENDDREQVMDNLYLRERLATEEAAGRASLGPGLLYRFRVAQDVEFVCIDTSKEHFFRRGRLFEYPKHQEFLRGAFPPKAEGGIRPITSCPARAGKCVLASPMGPTRLTPRAGHRRVTSCSSGSTAIP